MKTVYPAILSPRTSGNWGVSFPDLPGCVTSGTTLTDAVEMAADAANLWLVSAEDTRDPIPEPSAPSAVRLSSGEVSTLVPVDTDAYRRRLDTRSVRKNVSLPAWMAAYADSHGINCSGVLQDALRAMIE